MVRRDVLPEPTLYFEGHRIWLWETIESWVGRSGRGLPRPAAEPALIDLVGVGDIASRLEVEPRLVANWHVTGALPNPDYRWEAGDTWLWDTIERWARGRGRATSKIVRRRNERVRVQPRVETPLVRIEPEVEPVSVEPLSVDPLDEFDRLKAFFLKKSAEARGLVGRISA